MASVTLLPNKGSEEQRQCASRTSRDQGCDILSSTVVRPVNDAAVALGGPLRWRNAGSPTKRAAGLQEEAWSVRWAGELR
jgi:hypothetical protein